MQRLPIVLLPVRVETRFLPADRRDARRPPTELAVRIYPDELQVDPETGVLMGMPYCWRVVGYRGDRQVFSQDSRPIRPGLGVGVYGEEARWLSELDAAVEVGMAVRIPLTEGRLLQAVALQGLDALYVLGVRSISRLEPEHAGLLEGLLERHDRAHDPDNNNLDVLLRGTPTNNTEDERTGVSASAAGKVQAASQVLIPGDNAPNAGQALREALGLAEGSIVTRLPSSADGDIPLQRRMNHAVWRRTFEVLFEALIAGDGRNILSDDTLNRLRVHHSYNVFGGGPLPALRVGAQPYGILPTTLVQAVDEPWDGLSQLSRVLLRLKEYWDKSVKSVPRFDADAGDRVDDAVEDTRVFNAVMAAIPEGRLGLRRNMSQEARRVRFKGESNAPAVESSDTLDNYYQYFAKMMLDGDLPGSSGEVKVEGLREAVVSGLGARWKADDQHRAWRNVHSQMARRMGEIEDEQAKHNEVVAINHRLLRSFGLPNSSMAAIEADRDFAKLHPVHQELARDAYRRAKASKQAIAALDAEASAAQLAQHYATFARLLLEKHVARAAPLVAVSGLDEDKVITGMREWNAGKWKGDWNAPRALRTYFSKTYVWSASPVIVEDDGSLATHSFFYRVTDGDTSFGQRTRARVLRCLDDSLTEEEAQTGAHDALFMKHHARVSRTLLESVSTASHRLDAWFTSIATRRLRDLREDKPEGLYLGAWAYVEDLRPAMASPSQGHVLTPSAAHATTAAVLRSGFSVYSRGGVASPLAVDLSSERARRARWLLEGLRQGQGLGELLGARFERRLHDGRASLTSASTRAEPRAAEGLDHWIHRFRVAALKAAGREDEAPHQVVDGALLARAWGLEHGALDGTPTDPHAEALRAWIVAEVPDPKRISRIFRFGVRPTISAEEARRVREILDDTLADLDALSDSAMAEAVFSLVQGATERAGAALDALSGHDTPPPELLVARTHRPGRAVRHRLLLLAPETVQSGWAQGGLRATAAPYLEALAASVLPAPSRVVFRVDRLNAERDQVLESVALAVDALGWSALDALEQLPEGDVGAVGPLERAARAALVQRGFVDYEADPIAIVADEGGEDLLLEELMELASALRGLLGRCQPLSPQDLGLPGVSEAPAQVELDALLQRLRAVEASAGPAAFASQDPRDPGLPLAERVDLACAALRERSGLTLPPLPALTLDGPTLSALQQALAPGLATDTEARAWLSQLARVRDRVEDVVELMQLSELLAASDAPHTLRVGQHPRREDEPWAATHRPVGLTDNLVILAPAGLELGAKLVGLSVDAWEDRVPDAGQSGAAALHFDAPGAAAPQSILVAVPPHGKDWNDDWGDRDRDPVNHLLSVVRQTVELVRMRAVGPEHLEGLGQFLPAIFPLER